VGQQFRVGGVVAASERGVDVDGTAPERRCGCGCAMYWNEALNDHHTPHLTCATRDGGVHGLAGRGERVQAGAAGAARLRESRSRAQWAEEEEW
jgi:hypothetical protein